MDRYFHRRAVAGLPPDSVVWKDKSIGMLAPMPDSRWSEPVDLRHEALDARLGRLVNPERFRYAMDAAAEERARVRADLPAQRHPGDTAHVHRRHRLNVERLDSWLSAVGGD